MKKYLINVSIFLLLFDSCLLAQINEWGYSAGGTQKEYGNSIAVSKSGISYITGFYTSDTIIFNPNNKLVPFNNDYTNIYIAKLDKSGKNIWCKSLTGGANDEPQSIITDEANIYMCGAFSGRPTDFDPSSGIANVTSVSGDDGFIAKYDTSGNFLWVNTVNGEYYEEIMEATVDPEGNVYVIGNFNWSKVIFNISGNDTISLNSNGGLDIFIAKYNSSGVFQWVKQIGGTNDENAFSITNDSNGMLYIYGTFSSNTLDLDPSVAVYNLASTSQDNIFFAKFDKDGNFYWAKSIPTTMYQFNEDKQIVITNNGEVVITGNFSGTNIDFDPGVNNYLLSSFGSVDAFIAKYDSLGRFIFAKKIGGGFPDYSNSLAIDNYDNIVIVGVYYSNQVDFNPNDSVYLINKKGSVLYSDQFIAKYTKNGNLLWVESFGGSNSDAGLSIGVDSTNNIYTSGYFFSNSFKVDFLKDSSIISKKSSDADISFFKFTHGQDAYLRQDTTIYNYITVNKLNGRGNKSAVFAKLSEFEDSIPNIDGITFKDSAVFSKGDAISNTHWYCIYNGSDSIFTISGLQPNTTYEVVSLSYVDYDNTPIYFKDIYNDNHLLIQTLPVNCVSSTRVIDTTICVGESYYAGGSYQTTPGVYYDTIKNYLGCDSIIITTKLYFKACSITKINHISNSLKIYPNPIKNILHVEGDNYGQTEVVDLSGKLMIHSFSKAIDFSHQNEGCYVVRLYDVNNRLLISRLVIKIK